MTGPDLIAQATDFVADTAYPEAGVRDRARVLLADALSLALAADTVPGASALFELGVGSGDHLAWYGGRGLGAADAAQANAAAVCARFQDDTEMSSWSHPASFVVPAAVAAGIEAGASYGEVLDGLVAGYALTVWLGGGGQVALGMMRSGRRPSPNFGPAGACAAASRALGLDAEQTRNAVSGALLVGRGSLHSVGSGGEDWRLHNPGAARDGLVYALAARAGMTSGPGALEARHGYLAMFAGIEQVPDELRKPPAAEMILDVWHKALPTLGDNMAVALAARELHRRGVDGAALGHVTVHMNEHFANFPGTQTRPPYRSLTSALSSVRFVTAQLLLRGTLDFEDYARRDDPEVCALADRIDVVADPQLDFTDARIDVSTPDGDQSCVAADLPRTLFYRDADEQRTVTEELLGEPGVALVDALVEGDVDRSCDDVIQGALRTFHATTTGTEPKVK